eukprot:s1762_g4.t1
MAFMRPQVLRRGLTSGLASLQRPLSSLCSVPALPERLASGRQIFQNMSADSVNAVLRAPAAGVRPGQEAHRAQPLKSEPSPGFALLLPGPELPEERLTELDGRPQKPAMQALNTRKDYRRWKRRRKQDGGRNRHFRLKYG